MPHELPPGPTIPAREDVYLWDRYLAFFSEDGFAYWAVGDFYALVLCIVVLPWTESVYLASRWEEGSVRLWRPCLGWTSMFALSGCRWS